MTPLTPARPHSSTTPATVWAGVAMMTRSAVSGTAPMLGYALTPRISDLWLLTRYDFPSKSPRMKLTVTA